MAETKTRASTKGSRKPKSRSKPNRSKSSSSSTGSNSSRTQSARKAVQHTAREAGGTVGKAASKAKLPLVASGAAVAGAVGGLAVGAHQARRHKVLGMAMRQPQVKVRSRDLANAAKEVGSFGAQMGRLASELQQVREANGRHRSPLEVVLEGLTARRSRS
jgi:hypothetical protein